MAPSVDPATATVLITGGTSGIGLALAEEYAKRGAKVYVTSRRPSPSPATVPFEKGSITTITNDVSSASDRKALYDYVKTNIRDLNVFINNAGVARPAPLATESPESDWSERQKEIDTLLSGPMHLCTMLVPVMLANGRDGIVLNVTSGSAYVPIPLGPTYSACKWAMRCFTMNLQFSLRGTKVGAIELYPGYIKTNLSGSEHGEPLDEFIRGVWDRIVAGEEGIGYGMTDGEHIKAVRKLQQAMMDGLDKSIEGIPTYATRQNAEGQ